MHVSASLDIPWPDRTAAKVVQDRIDADRAAAIAKPGIGKLISGAIDSSVERGKAKQATRKQASE